MADAIEFIRENRIELRIFLIVRSVFDFGRMQEHTGAMAHSYGDFRQTGG